MVTMSHDSAETRRAAAEAQTGPLRLPRSRRRFAIWGFIAVVLAITTIAGATAWRILDTFDALHSRSTPPPIVSGSVLGGSPDVQIDSGPALTSVASAGQPTATPTATPTRTPWPTSIASDLVSTSTPKPRSTRTPTEAPEPTETPEPTPTPVGTVLSEIERIENGSFEAGLTPWYIEDGAGPVQVPDAVDGQFVLRLPAPGAYVDQRTFYVPGTSYLLTGWGRLTAEGDSGVLGVVYQDAAGTRLRDLEPDPIEFTRTKFTEGELAFTPPAEVASVLVYIYKAEGAAALEVDALSLRSVVQPFADGGSAAAPPALADGAMTIVFMGVDARPGEEIDGEVRPDSLMVVHLNPQSSSCRVLSIPRDTRAELPGYGQTKINHALALGGIDYQLQVIEGLTGLPIDHFALVDFSGFEELVDAVGGIEVDVPEGFTAVDSTVFVAGPQKMKGKQALSYARHRGGPDGDFGRIQRQQQIIRALVRKASGLEVLTSLNELLPAVSDNIRTDLTIPEMVSIASTYRDICTEDAVTMFRLEGQVMTMDDPLLKQPLSYVVVDEAEIRRKVAMLLEA